VPKIFCLVPVNTDRWTAVHEDELNRYKDPATEIVVEPLDLGAESIECGYDDAWNALPTIVAVEKAERDGFDGVILSCFGDPALRAAREAVEIPVVGVAEASIHLASQLGRRFGVITAGPPDAGAYILDNFRMYQMDHKCVEVTSLGTCVLDLGGDPAAEVAKFVEAARELQVHGADVIVIGCTGMTAIADSLAAAIPVPVVNPAPTALKFCEDLIALGLSHSKSAFPCPARKARVRGYGDKR